jgi:HAMP domain-containing protein
MTILMFLEMAHLVLCFFCANSFAGKFVESRKPYYLFGCLMSLASMPAPAGALLSQILFNAGLNVLAAGAYKFLIFSFAANIFITAVFNIEILGFKKFRPAYFLFAFISLWFIFKNFGASTVLIFKNEMIQPLGQKWVESPFSQSALVLVVLDLIFLSLLLKASWSKSYSDLQRRQYFNMVFLPLSAISMFILALAYTYVNISWLYLSAWMAGVVWIFFLFIVLSVFDSEDPALVYNPFNVLWRHLSYKFVFSAFLAIFTLIMLMAVLLGHSISSGLHQSLDVLGVSREVVVSLIGANQNLVVSIGLCGTVLLALFSHGVIRAQTRPFEKMVVDLRGMPPGQWTPLTGNFGKDEAGQLVQAFNRMVLTVKSQTAEILKNNESLMQGNAVADKRNKELIRANEILSEKKRELEEFEDAAIRRELYMVELKRQIEAKKNAPGALAC